MNCLGFETLLADLLETHAAERLVTAARKHLTDCEDCVELWKTVQPNPKSDLDRKLTHSILKETSGLPCERVRTILGQAADPDQEIVSLHMSHCSDCRLWALWMAWQKRSPTVPDRPGAIRYGRRLVELFERSLRRPRFGLEAAYAGTLLFFLLLSSPVEWSDTLRSVNRNAQLHPLNPPLSQAIRSSRMRISREFETAQSTLRSELKIGVDKVGSVFETVDRSVGNAYTAVSHVPGWLFSSVDAVLTDQRHVELDPDDN